MAATSFGSAVGEKPQVLSIGPGDKVFTTDGCQPRQTTTTVSADCGAPGEFPALGAEAQLPTNIGSFNAAARGWLDCDCRGPRWSALGCAVLRSVWPSEGGFSIVMATARPISENRSDTHWLLAANRSWRRVSAAAPPNQLTGSGHGRHTVDPYRCRNSDRAGNHKVLNEAMKVALRIVPDVGAQPRCAPPHQIGLQGIRFRATNFTSWRIAANVSPAPIVTKTASHSTVLRCGLAASARAQARLVSCRSRTTITIARMSLVQRQSAAFLDRWPARRRRGGHAVGHGAVRQGCACGCSCVPPCQCVARLTRSRCLAANSRSWAAISRPVR
jgi:hypothetical protein